MSLLRRSLALGLAFGLAAVVVEFGFQAFATISRRFGPGAGFMLETALLELGLACAIGLVGAPLLRLRGGRVWLVLWLGLVWLGLGLAVEFDAPMGRPMAIGPAVGGTVLLALGLLLARWSRLAPWALGAGLLAAALATPQIYIAATSAEAAPAARVTPAPEDAPDVVLIVLDTVRAESTSTYGYQRGTAPTLDALAKEGALFADATSPSTWSLPSHASLFTGRYPSGHGAHGEHLTLDDRYPTLAQVLASRGYETVCFTANAWISDGLGLTRGFSFQDRSWQDEAGAGRNFSFIYRLLDRMGLVAGDKGGATVASHFADWVAGRSADERPFFAFLNFIEAHFPYHQLPGEYLSRYTDVAPSELEEISMTLMGQQFGGPGMDVEAATGPAVDMYDGGILYTDELLRRVVEALRARGTLDRTILVVLADHGEILGERAGYFGHGPSLYQEVVSVPLLVRYPPAVPAGVRVETPVSTVGAFATIVDLAAVEPPPTLHVGSLAPLARGEPWSGAVLSELTRATALGGGGRALDDPQMQDARYRAYRDGHWKLVESSTGDAFLYDLASDPDEARDLAVDRPAELARMQSQLAQWQSQLGLPALDGEFESGGSATELDAETQERLRELGYIE